MSFFYRAILTLMLTAVLSLPMLYIATIATVARMRSPYPNPDVPFFDPYPHRHPVEWHAVRDSNNQLTHSLIRDIFDLPENEWRELESRSDVRITVWVSGKTKITGPISFTPTWRVRYIAGQNWPLTQIPDSFDGAEARSTILNEIARDYGIPPESIREALETEYIASTTYDITGESKQFAQTWVIMLIIAMNGTAAYLFTRSVTK